ncbi:hypothetical protein F5Y16DRAFT_402808 [Xylariaceae sp. FL0255]|nr:hypothetical protein F5Y16DRAFT_402808 [Xylariaceae sp. FL0255]
MFTSIIATALVAAPLVAAHGKTTVFTGSEGGNGTALGVQGNVVALVGQNYQTEPDTTIFWSKDINTDQDFGFTDSSGGNLGMKDLAAAMELSGLTLPQVSASGGSIKGSWHVVTSDGAGPLQAIIDPTASGSFSNATDLDVTTQPPGSDGWIDTTPSAAALAAGNGRIIERGTRTTKRGASRTVGKRQTATLVDKDYDMEIAIPSGIKCTGTANGQSNLCAVKVSNNNENGPFGSVLIIQQTS